MKKNPTTETSVDDPETQALLKHLTVDSKILGNRVPGVKSVLFVLSSRGMVFDTDSLKQKTTLAYPGAAVYMLTPSGKPLGALAPARVDLLIDFTPPRARQGLFFSHKLRRKARVAVGRNSGLFRKKIYDRVFDEFDSSLALPTELLQRERLIGRELMGLAGVAMVQAGDTHPDRGKVIALELPPLAARP